MTSTLTPPEATSIPHPIVATATNQLNIVFAGGGSGGHIAPALAVSERLIHTGRQSKSHFICSTRAIDHHMLAHAGVGFTPIDAAPLSMRPRGMARFAWQLPKSIRQAQHLLEQWQADVVLGMGGFVAAPVVRAAKRIGVPAILMNLDRPPGKANRLMARWADEIWTTVDLGPNSRFASRMVGPPVRRAALACQTPAACKSALGLDPDRPVLLITGASQGATSINMLAARLVEHHAHWLGRWQVLHLAGHAAGDGLSEACAAAGVDAVVCAFLDAMGLAWGAADLTISRAGANSVAEISANAIPSIFLPYPYHRDQHQRHNAQPLVNLGGAVMLQDHINPERNLLIHGPIIKTLLTDEAKRHTMKQAMIAARPVDAAGEIANLLVSRIAHGRSAAQGD